MVVFNKKYFPQFEIKEIIDAYLSGKSTTEIGRQFNVNFKVILRILRENNIIIRKQKINLTEQEINNIVINYNLGLSSKQISKKFNINYSKIKKIIKFSNLIIRPSAQYTKKLSSQEINNLINDYRQNFSYQKLSEKYNCSVMLIKKEIKKNLYSADNIFCKDCRETKEKIYFFDKKQFNICNQCRKNNSLIKRERRNKQRILKRTTNPCNLIRHNISSSIRNYLIKHGNNDGNKKFSSLSYSKQDLKNHLESLFDPWMNWSNYGRYDSKSWRDKDPSTWTWQIDHIIPASTFNYSSTDDESFKKCWGLDNLRPLSSKQNYLDGVRRSRHKKP